MHDALWADAWQWRLAYERRGGTGVARLLDVIEEAQEQREQHVVLG
jgi:hypothetical protein